MMTPVCSLLLLVLLVACVQGAAVNDLALIDDLADVDVTVEDDTRLKERYDFVNTRNAKYSELETRASVHGIKAIDTMTATSRTNGIFYRVVTNGKRIIQAVYEGEGRLVDCDISNDEETLKRFMERFLGVDKYATNETMRIIDDDSELSQEETNMISMRTLVEKCRQLQRRLKSEMELDGAGEASSKTNDVSSQQPRRRMKRSSMLIYPGTNWCGRGSTASHFEDLGDNVATDKCCRSHDFCPYMIEGFTTKYSLFNYRFTTLSHCGCDLNFRSCLKSADNSVAHMVGSIYFNVAATECFILIPEVSCGKRSWWGKCLEQTKTYTAVVQEPLTY